MRNEQDSYNDKPSPARFANYKSPTYIPEAVRLAAVKEQNKVLRGKGMFHKYNKK